MSHDILCTYVYHIQKLGMKFAQVILFNQFMELSFLAHLLVSQTKKQRKNLVRRLLIGIRVTVGTYLISL